MDGGRLYIVGTPLGNLEDMSPRAVRVLQEAAVVAAEDTRTAMRLFARFGIATPTTSFFEGNEAARTATLVERMRQGEAVALISEAGMPGVSDPGERLVRAAVEAGIPVEVVPGPSAAVTALVGSGLPADRFTFLGFLPREAGKRREMLARTYAIEGTLIVYEAANRTAATLADLGAILGGERRACIARELTKLHEEYLRGTLAELAARAAAEPPRGEVTLVVEGAPATVEHARTLPEVEAEVDRRLRAGESPKDIAAALSLATGKPRRQLYQLALARKRHVLE